MQAFFKYNIDPFQYIDKNKHFFTLYFLSFFLSRCMLLVEEISCIFFCMKEMWPFHPEILDAEIIDVICPDPLTSDRSCLKNP